MDIARPLGRLLSPWTYGTAALVAAALLPAAAAEPGNVGAWLNVRDYGASGSDFQTTAVATAGSRAITVKDRGDFAAGQTVMVSKCHPRISEERLWGPRGAKIPPMKELVNLRGYDETAGGWTAFILDVERADPPSFRWSDDLGRTWQPKTAMTYNWQPLRGGLEVRFHKFDWKAGYIATFSARDLLVTTIEKIEENRLMLKDAATRSVQDAVVRHCDDAPIQAVIDRAIREKRNVFIPAGLYRLSRGLKINNAGGLVVEGADGVNTVLDNSEIEQPDGRSGIDYGCFTMRFGTEVTLRNMRLVGFSGLSARDQVSVPVWGIGRLWGMQVKGCRATEVFRTERVLIENVHASRMFMECFYSTGHSRAGLKEPDKGYTKALMYLRCSASDCAFNAFNNNDFMENTSILHCRAQDVGGDMWEGGGRFVKIVGNYVRNAGPVGIHVGKRSEEMEVLPAGQHIVSENVFEGGGRYDEHGAIQVWEGPTPVVITHNLFVNWGAPAVRLRGLGGAPPPRNCTVAGNLFDMTEVGPESRKRCAVEIAFNDVIVSDNQIYVRGAADPQVTGIEIQECALNANVHDNLIRNCGGGIVTARAEARVWKMVGDDTLDRPWGTVPFEGLRSHRYRGWNLVWTKEGKATGTSVIEDFDPTSCRFKLKEPRPGMKEGDAFEVYPPEGANWNIHANTVTGCLNPVVLDCYGGETSFFSANIITRGNASGVAKAVLIGGRFNVVGNHVFGFDEAGAAALALRPDPLGRPCRNLLRDNIVQRCAIAVSETQPGLWKAATTSENVFLECDGVPAQGPSCVPQLRERSRSVLAQLEGQAPLAGLREPVEVLRDRWGIAHIYARNQHDLFVAQGFVVAQDRLFQLDLWRRVGCGELAELFGAEAVEGDRFARLVQFRGDWGAEWSSYAPDAKEIIAAFVEGLNSYLDFIGPKLPIEFQILGYTPRRWRPEDIVGRMSGIIMSGNWQRELARARLISAVGGDKARRLAPTDPPRQFALDPDLENVSWPLDITKGYEAAARSLVFRPSTSESNNWVVDGTLSSSGKPMLASDPHRTLALPSLRYIVHLQAPGWNVIGSGEPALPGVAIGHNDQIAWGFTIVNTDQADLYVENTHPDDPRRYRVGDRWEPMRVVREAVRVKGRKDPHIVELRYTRHGPVIYQDEQKRLAMALKWAGLEPGGAAYLGSLSVGRARNRREFLRDMEAWKVPCLNFVFADVDGDIGWIAAGLTPMRHCGDGLLPVPGTSGKYEWQGFLPVRELPQRFKPAEHWIATANHNILPAGYLHTIAYDWEPPFRYGRVRERLLQAPASGKFNIGDFQSIQHDNTSLAARALISVLRSVEVREDLVPWAQRLTSWNAELSQDSSPALLYAVWFQELERSFFASRVFGDAPLDYRVRNLERMIDKLATPDEAWFGTEPAKNRDRLMLDTLARAVSRVGKMAGDDPARWRWGQLHTATFRHPLSGLGAAFAQAFDLGPVTRPGDATTPNCTRHNAQLQQVHGASYRQVFDLADWDRGVATSTPGQSGQPGSPHYDDLLPLWADGQYFPLSYSRAKVESVTKHRLILRPQNR